VDDGRVEQPDGPRADKIRDRGNDGGVDRATGKGEGGMATVSASRSCSSTTSTPRSRILLMKWAVASRAEISRGRGTKVEERRGTEDFVGGTAGRPPTVPVVLTSVDSTTEQDRSAAWG
jgi:hypothetical protein